MKTNKRLWILLLVALAVGYGAGVETVLQFRGHEARIQTAKAKAQLADIVKQVEAQSQQHRL